MYGIFLHHTLIELFIQTIADLSLVGQIHPLIVLSLSLEMYDVKDLQPNCTS